MTCDEIEMMRGNFLSWQNSDSDLIDSAVTKRSGCNGSKKESSKESTC